jgi:PIN domain nuclease of toxin-antitoxin system
LLLDTHVVIWALAAPQRIPAFISQSLRSLENQLFISAACAWEIAIKRSRGRLEFPTEDFEVLLARLGATHLPISHTHGTVAGALPRHHADPFDRILIAQALVEDLTLVTSDAAIMRYDVRVLGTTPA